jgi:hypothetical protein
MPFDPTTHHSVKTREGSVPGRVTPHLLLTSEEGQIIIQGGEWYTAGGVLIDENDVPDWAWDTAKKLSAETRESLGLEPLPAAQAAKNVSKQPSINVDQQAQGGTPMQLSKGDFETDGKASPVPQDDEDYDDEGEKSKPVAKAPVPTAKSVGKK